MNKFARSPNKWIGACDRLLASLIHTCITQMITDNIIMWETRLSIVVWVFIPRLSFFLETLKTLNQLREECIVSFGSRTFVSISWMCKKQTSVSHSSTESEAISFHACLRMDGLPALDLWSVVIEVFRSSNSSKTPTNPATGNCSRNHKYKTRHMGNRDVDQLSHVDYLTHKRIGNPSSKNQCKRSIDVTKV